MPVTRRPTRRFLSEGLRLTADRVAVRGHVPWHGPIVVWGGRISDGRLLPPELAFGLPSPERASAPAAGADPAPLQDASGSTPRGQDVFFIFL